MIAWTTDFSLLVSRRSGTGRSDGLRHPVLCGRVRRAAGLPTIRRRHRGKDLGLCFSAELRAERLAAGLATSGTHACAGDEALDAAALAGVTDQYAHGLFDGDAGDGHRESRVAVAKALGDAQVSSAWALAATSRFVSEVVSRRLHQAGVDGDVIADLEGVLAMGCLDAGLFCEVNAKRAEHESQEMLSKFNTLVEEGAMSLLGGITTLDIVVQKQMSATQAQASAVAEVASSLSELRQTSSQAREQAQDLLQTAETAQDAADKGAETVSQSVEGVGAVRDRVETIQQRIRALADQTRQIGDIISTVNEIAEQSKLLALNASIEAARAGEFGRSFSVVANEMHDLAEQSKQATRQVRELLSGIQGATTEAVVATEEGVAETNLGQARITEAGDIISELAGAVAQAVDASRLVANASRQQGEGVS